MANATASDGHRYRKRWQSLPQAFLRHSTKPQAVQCMSTSVFAAELLYDDTLATGFGQFLRLKALLPIIRKEAFAGLRIRLD